MRPRGSPFTPALGALVIALGMLPCQWAHAATALEERAEITKATRDGFSRGEFETLEKAAEQYRREKSRTLDGTWKLTVFYAAIGEGIKGCAKDLDPDIAYDASEEKAKQWAARYPGSPTGYIVHGMVLTARAWAYRGCGYADTVSEDAWANFRKFVAASRTILEAHKDVASLDPQWYGEMLVVGRAQQWSDAEFNALLDEALDREPLYYQTYFSALESLLPKWGGDIGQIEDFAQAAVARTRASEGQGLYARVYWYASRTQYKGNLFDETLADWAQFKAGFEDIISRYPDAWNLNNYARYACMARDKGKTLELLKRIGSSVTPDAWVPLALKTECANWASRP